jgi:hypothetical protein
MRTSDRHEPTHGNGLGERCSAAHDGNAEGACTLELRVTGGDGRGNNERPHIINVRWVVPREYVDAKSFEISGGAGVGVAPGDGDAAPREELRERTHPGAGGSHKMHRPRVGGSEK